MIRLDKSTFHVKTVHVDLAAADTAHNILQHKFGKTSNNKLKEFMTNKETIDKHKMKELIAESNGKAFLELPDTSELGSSLYVLFMPEKFLFSKMKLSFKKHLKSSACSSLRLNFV